VASKHLRRAPKKVLSATDRRDNWWWYEEPRGICIVHVTPPPGASTAYAYISHRQLRAYLAKLDRNP
jgi:hypothetical protein